MQKRALKKLNVYLLLFMFTLALSMVSTAMGAGTELLINGGFADLSGWNNWPLYSANFAYCNMWGRMLDDWSIQGYMYQKVGSVTAAGVQYDASADITHRIYDNQLAGTTNYNCDMLVVLTDPSLDPTTDYLRGYDNGSGITQDAAATTVIFLNHNLTLNASSPTTSGSTGCEGYWDPETHYSSSYTTVTGDIGKDIYVLVSGDIDLAPNDSGLQSGVTIACLIAEVPPPIEYPFGDINEDTFVNFLDVVELFIDWLDCNNYDDLSCHPD